MLIIVSILFVFMLRIIMVLELVCDFFIVVLSLL